MASIYPKAISAQDPSLPKKALSSIAVKAGLSLYH
jgi:hypothetical protein